MRFVDEVSGRSGIVRNFINTWKGATWNLFSQMRVNYKYKYACACIMSMHDVHNRPWSHRCPPYMSRVLDVSISGAH